MDTGPHDIFARCPSDGRSTRAVGISGLGTDTQRRSPVPRLHHNEMQQERITSYATALALTVLAFIVRFWRISHPDQVVFDEVHFGSFAGHYIRREYYFDVHPPLAKMLNAGAAWLFGFDGIFAFRNIGDNYTAANVPFIGMRSFCAVMGSVTVPLVYGIMRESGYPVAIAAFSAFLILFGLSKLGSGNADNRQWAHYPNPFDPPRRCLGSLYGALPLVLCQIPPTAVQRV